MFGDSPSGYAQYRPDGEVDTGTDALQHAIVIQISKLKEPPEEGDVIELRTDGPVSEFV